MKAQALACMLLGCSASVPAELPRTSAASPSASAAPLPSMGASLREESPPVEDAGPPTHHGMEGMPGMSGTSHGAP